MFLSIFTRASDSALESQGTFAIGFQSHRVAKAAPTTTIWPTMPGNLAAELPGDRMSCWDWLGEALTGVPTPNMSVFSITCPSTAESTLAVTVYWPSGRFGWSVTPIDAVSPSMLCLSFVSTLLPSGPITFMVL